MQRLFKRLTVSHPGRSHQGYFHAFDFTFTLANHHLHRVSPSKGRSQEDGTAGARNHARVKQRQDLKAKVYEWMEGIPREDELLDPNFYGADGVGERESEWLRSAAPSTGSRIDGPESSTAVGEGVADGCDRDLQYVVVKGGARSDGDLPLLEDLALALRSMDRDGYEQQRAKLEREKEPRRAEQSATTTAENTGPPARFFQAATDTLQTEVLKKFVPGGVASQTPLQSSKSCTLPKKDKTERLPVWKRVTKRYSTLN
ncbi:hypothetical protein HOY80DRAFT_628641 [Tuber brumale]|nr:hypothetical protein HOY80DRAFT_628641 [Tuber brumale]